MPHGDGSDFVGLSLLFAGLASIFYPESWVYSNDYMKGMLDGPLDNNTTIAISFAGSLMVLLGFVTYVVRWNTINGKFAAGPGCILAAINCIYIPYQMALKTDGLFVFRAWHCFAGVFLFGAYHMIYNANLPWTSETLKIKEAEKAAKDAKKK